MMANIIFFVLGGVLGMAVGALISIGYVLIGSDVKGGEKLDDPFD